MRSRARAPRASRRPDPRGRGRRGRHGGFPAVYPILRALEECRVASGAATSSTVWAPPSSRCRAQSTVCARCANPNRRSRSARVLAATDPANPYGAAIAVAASRRRRSPAAASAPPARTWSWSTGRRLLYLERGGGVDPDPAGRRRSRRSPHVPSTRSGAGRRRARAGARDLDGRRSTRRRVAAARGDARCRLRAGLPGPRAAV